MEGTTPRAAGTLGQEKVYLINTNCKSLTRQHSRSLIT